MTTWKVLLLCMLPCYQAGSDGIYECGAHGRFEYCIDDIPGCVVGCHCHPGYYFDTETKICEPNTKLTLNYRHRYVPEPTRIQNPKFIPIIEQTVTVPALTTQNVIDEHVNDITKNADDLGDWLYNQFFKTIENQVINNTNKDSQLTRRSGRGSLPKHNKLKRRARRKGNKHKKKKKGLKGKLLRIAEDDSLFQSSDSSDSESSGGDSSQSDSSFRSDSDEDHGHKKIVLINKKQRPPLPSFIFLPNLNTPYYPPIGLPPPPVMPMYPMVPVPPMLPPPPMFPCPGNIPHCDENTTTDTTETDTTVTPTTTDKISTEEVSTDTSSVSTTTPSDEPSTETPAQRSRLRGRKRKKIKPVEHVPDEYEELPSDTYDPTLGSRQKLMKLLRQRINYPRNEDASFKKHKKPFDRYISQLIPPDTLMNNDLNDDVLPKSINPSPTNLENNSELENVDFKYLSQLIHRVGENQTQDVPIRDTYNIRDPPKNILRKWPNKMSRDFIVPLDSGRRVYQNINSSTNHQADDSYYSNLGRQIATLIRTIDADNERQFNVEIEKVQQKPSDHPYFNENGPRTFWERSVRSPLRFPQSFRNKFYNSNELLFNIENRVETVVSTAPTLSLHELENLISVMDKARNQFQRNTKINNVEPLPRTLNVNLWPREMTQFKKSIKSYTAPNIFAKNRRKAINYSNNTRPEILNTKPKNVRENLYTFSNSVKMHNANDGFIREHLQIPPTLKNRTIIYSQPMYKQNEQKSQRSSETHRHIMNPTVLNHKNIKKYFFDNNNQYSFQNDQLRLHYPPISSNKQQNNPLPSSPYFHHEINHIDYIP